MTRSAVVSTDLRDAGDAGRRLGEGIREELGSTPDALIVFASTDYEYPLLLEALQDSCEPGCLVGGSSAGEFTDDTLGEGLACALGLVSDELKFTASSGRELRRDRDRAARELVAGLQGLNDADYAFRSALVLTDAVAGHADDLVNKLTSLTAGTYRLFGGGVGGDASFSGTRVFCGTEAIPDAIVALEILSNKPLGIGVAHAWEPASDRFRVTEADGTVLRSLNAIPAAEVYADYAQASGQAFDFDDPLPFFLHNVIGIEMPDGSYKLRVPLSVDDERSIVCATEIPVGATVRVMKTAAPLAAGAASRATGSALEQLGGEPPSAALFFDCVATRMRLGEEFGSEIDAVRKALGDSQLVGCNTIGQIARVEGQFSGFHNCTAVICLIPR